ncbi:hypothetical protein GXP67_03310 [Rhodocytophaga rosea]|uniref:LPXTG cell wall anchor domain-containing protein n=1 Tax=Rhodocytophaga rosea TaxID=2704465 RepID=A0A6C0GDC5_9BACT|nr:hypothetical protein [Rhodocytophaga rosea]QHT65762.1 hypothetical protein GXP67_03310 [Rhodocytophaga rosea]
MKNTILKSFLVVSFISFFSMSSFALKPDTDIPHKGKDHPKKIPIDGGLSLLLAAGIGLGASKFLFQKKETSE